MRHGRFGTSYPVPLSVYRCGACDAGFLGDVPAVDYAGPEYRELVDGPSDDGATLRERFHRLHDADQAAKLAQLGTGALRGRVVMDVGCGAGAFLDLVACYAAGTVAVEPAEAYHDGLREAGHAVFPYCADVAARRPASVDTAVCFSVIEHVSDPLALLRDVRAALRPGGTLLLSTGNADDWLLELLPEDYGAFFYRTVHCWYLSAASLRWLAREAGFASCDVRCVHRFGLSNFLLWLRDRRPTGVGKLPLPPVLNAAFRATVEEMGRADYLYATLRA